MGNVLNEISIERMRQCDREGYTDVHDDEHDQGELSAAAAAYALHASDQLHPQSQGDGADDIKAIWPWDKASFKPKNPRRDLIRAAALIVAEIERMDRLESGDEAGQTP